MLDLFIKTPRGLCINPKITTEVILIVSDDVIDDQGEVLNIFGYGGLIFFKNSKGNPVKAECVLSTRFNTMPSAIRDVEYLKGYKELHYTDGSFFALADTQLDMTNNLFPVIKDSTNVEMFFNKFIGGKLSNCVSYDNQIHVVLNNLDLNKHLGNVPFIYYEILIAETFINKNGVPYRLNPIGEPNQISLLQKTMTLDAFSGVTHQDSSTALLVAMSDKNKVDIPSDLERISVQ